VTLLKPSKPAILTFSTSSNPGGAEDHTGGHGAEAEGRSAAIAPELSTASRIIFEHCADVGIGELSLSTPGGN
jgi:hypothetical protein